MTQLVQNKTDIKNGTYGSVFDCRHMMEELSAGRQGRRREWRCHEGG